MRLLKTNNPSHPVLKIFIDTDDAPPYAIFSHTWSESEISFHAMENLDGKLKESAGLAKIQSACQIAKQQGFRYLGVDTCCIDKTSSGELSEAINSMFRWYQRAKVCYAHLADIVSQYSWRTVSRQDDFIQSRWFTRGWTLQELTAPSNVEFYTADWRFIGTKTSLKQKLSERTGIPIRALLGAWVRKFGAAQIFSWASTRSTTRIEDSAYSLLGLFDMYLPLIYGEGHNAFQRLQEEILKRDKDHTVFAWTRNDTFSSLESFRPSGLFASSPSNFLRSDKIFPIYGEETTLIEVSRREVQLKLPYIQGAAYTRVALSCSVSAAGSVTRLWLELAPAASGRPFASPDWFVSSLERNIDWLQTSRLCTQAKDPRPCPSKIFRIRSLAFAERNDAQFHLVIHTFHSKLAFVSSFPPGAWDTSRYESQGFWISESSMTEFHPTERTKPGILGGLVFKTLSASEAFFIVLFEQGRFGPCIYHSMEIIDESDLLDRCQVDLDVYFALKSQPILMLNDYFALKPQSMPILNPVSLEDKRIYGVRGPLDHLWGWTTLLI